jgi:hypothetical protein
LHRWRTHIPGIPDTKGVTSDAKCAGDAKTTLSGDAGETGEAEVFTLAGVFKEIP